ncbi:MAG: hypothetical protein AABZ60_00450, partial [Planctomycetota bacterium]
MNCADLSTYYSEAYEKLLSFEEQQAFEGHLQQCSLCQQEYHQFIQALTFLQENKPLFSLPENFDRQVIEASYRLLRPFRDIRKIWLSGFLLGAALILVVGGFFWASTRSKSNDLAPPGFVY